MHATRERFLVASADLFQAQGYNGTAVKQIVESAGAPFASMYHFFPGGKEELGAETIRWSGAIYGGLLDLFFQGGDLAAETEAFFAAAADTVRDSGYAEGCPIATVALEVATTSEVLRLATADVFEAWIVAATARFDAGGIDPAAARPLAVSIISLLEGAFVLARAMHDESHLIAAGATATLAVKEALAPAGRGAPATDATSTGAAKVKDKGKKNVKAKGDAKTKTTSKSRHKARDKVRHEADRASGVPS